jgi:putative transposase
VVEFTSGDFTGALKQRGIQISMDGRRRAVDNIFVERLWRSVKYEEVYSRITGMGTRPLRAWGPTSASTTPSGRTRL